MLVWVVQLIIFWCRNHHVKYLTAAKTASCWCHMYLIVGLSVNLNNMESLMRWLFKKTEKVTA